MVETRYSADPETVRTFYRRVVPNLYQLGPSGEKVFCGEFISDLFSLRGTFLGCVTYRVQDQTAGLVCITESGGEASIDSVYVASLFRGKGVGLTLLDRASTELCAVGHKRINVDVRSKRIKRLLAKMSRCDMIRIKSEDYDEFVDDWLDALFTPDEHPSLPYWIW